MPKIPACDRCLFYSHNYHLMCVPHPNGVDTVTCPDFSPDPAIEGKHFEDFLEIQFETGAELNHYEMPIDNPFNLDPDQELWEPEGASYYNGELILQPRQRWTPEEQLELLDWHPLFTGRSPRCERLFPRYETPPVHWDCPSCSWVDDTV